MADSDLDNDEFAKLAESFVERRQRGQRPSIEQFAAEHPHLADRIRSLFPALEVLEELAPDSASLGGLNRLADSQVPESIGGYRILREIGRGGMGIVYEAEQPALRRRVALKVLPESVRNNPKAIERFRLEAQSAARLQHPGIVPVFEVGEDGRCAFYVMQFVNGQGLDAVMTELRRLRDTTKRESGTRVSDAKSPVSFTAHSLMNGSFARIPRDERRMTQHPGIGDSISVTTKVAVLPEYDTTLDGNPQSYFRSVALIGVQVGRALAHAHALGVVHRDVKPSNLLLDSQGGVWVTDFGLAKAEDDGLTQSGEIVGTLRYMAPERFRGWADPRSDVYSLGITLFEMAALQPAFRMVDRLRLMQQISEVGPPRPRTLDGRIPPDLETIILKAVDREPTRRYQTADLLADDLQRFLEDQPIQARRSSRVDRVRRWCRRNPLSALLAILLAATFFGGFLSAAIAAFQFRDLAEQERESADGARLERRNAMAAQQRAERARKASEAAKRDATRHLIRLNVAQGLQAEANGDPFRAMIRHGEALRLAEVLGIDEFPHRLRLARLQRACPSLRSVWIPEVATGTPRKVSPGGFLTLSPTGNSAIIGNKKRSERNGTPTVLADPQSGRLITTLDDGTSPPWLLRYSADGRFVAVAWQDGRVRIWNTTTGKAVGQVLQHSARVSVRFSPDARQLVTRGFRPHQSCRIWNITTSTVSLDFNRLGVEVYDVLFSPDGKSVAGRMRRNAVQVWSLKTGKPVSPRFQLGPGTTRVAFSPDAAWIAAADRSATCWVCNLKTRTVRSFKNGFPVRQIRFSPDSKRLLVNGNRSIAVWDMTQQDPIRTAEHGATIGQVHANANGSRVRLVDRYLPRRATLVDVATGKSTSLPGFVPDGMERPLEAAGGRSVFVTVQGSDVFVCDLNAGQQTARLAHADSVRRVSPCSDGVHLVTMDGDRNARVWNAVTGRPLSPPLPHHRRVLAAVYDPRNKSLLTRDADDVVRTWNISAHAEERLALKHDAVVTAIGWSANSQAAYTASLDRTAKIWNSTTGKMLATLAHPTPVVTLASNVKLSCVATGGADGLLRLWHPDTGRLLKPPMRHGDVLRSIELHAATRQVLASGGWPTLWNVDTGTRRLQLRPAASSIAAIDPQGRLIATAGDRRTGRGRVLLFDATTGKQLAPLPDTPDAIATSITFSPDGRQLLTAFGRQRVSYSRDGQARIPDPDRDVKPQPQAAVVWNVESRRVVARLPHDDGIRSAKFSPDGKQVVTASDDSTARIWDAATGRPATPPLKHNDQVMHAGFGPLGRLVVTGSRDNTARVWDRATGELVASWPHPGSVTRVEISPDGKSLLTACDDGVARVYGLRPDPRPVGTIINDLQLLCARTIESQGLIPINRQRIQQLKARKTRETPK